MRVKKLSLGLMILLGLVFVANSALAFMLKPMSLKIEGKRGKTQTQIFTVRNSRDKPIHCRVYATGFEVSRNGEYLLENAAGKYSALDWIRIKETEFNIPANDSKEVKVEISVPRNTRPGEYFAVVMAENRGPTQIKASEKRKFLIPIIIRMACIIRITVPGRIITKKAEISEIKVEVPGPESKEKNIKVIATLENKCQIHLDAKGEVKIKNLEGRVFDKFILQGAGKNVRGEAFVYPEGMRDFWGIITRPLPPGEYVAEASFNYGYKFRKIRAKKGFTITEAMAVKQKEFLVLKAEPELLELKIPAGGFRTSGIKVSNLDYQPVHLKMYFSSIAHPSWIRLSESEFDLPPGRSKTIRAILSIPKGEKPERSIKIILKADRGKKVVVDVVVLNPRIEKEKIAKKDEGNL